MGTTINGNGYIALRGDSGKRMGIDANSTRTDAFSVPVTLGTAFGGTQNMYVSPAGAAAIKRLEAGRGGGNEVFSVVGGGKDAMDLFGTDDSIAADRNQMKL